MKVIFIFLFCIITWGLAGQDYQIRRDVRTNNKMVSNYMMGDRFKNGIKSGWIKNEMPAFRSDFSPGDSAIRKSSQDSVKRKTLKNEFKFDLSSLLSSQVIIGGEFLLKRRITLESWVGGVFQFNKKSIKKSGFVFRSGVKWYPLKKYNPAKPLEGFYVKGELGYTKMSFRWIVDYRYNLFANIPVYSRESYVINNYAIHFYGGYQQSISRTITMDLCAGLGSSIQTTNYNQLHFHPEIPGIYSLVGNNTLSAVFNISLGTAF